MSNVIELEASYVLHDGFEKILRLIEEKGFRFLDENTEEDTYYSDKEDVFIKDRICLRTRKKNEDFLELTYKPKTDNSTEKYGKREINVELQVKDYEDISFMLEELGYYKYIRFKKIRKTYTKLIDGIKYNIMLDEIPNVGKFVEFEILASSEEEKEALREALDEFVSTFECDYYEEKKAPYRDIVKAKLG